ncbi:MAG: peroxiredoxin family protein [Limisphaerales bacterium]
MKHSSRHHTALLLSCILLLTLIGGCSSPKPGTSTTDNGNTPTTRLSLPTPSNLAHRTYLGLPETNPEFLIGEIQADILIIDCFDLYCPSCQRGASKINELFNLITQSNLQSRIKMIGLGLGNTPLEVETFRKKYEIQFPLFPDRTSTVARQFGEVRIPGLLVIRPGSTPRVIHRKAGILREPRELLDHILNLPREEAFIPTNSFQFPASDSCGDEECPVTISGNPTASLI